MATSSRDVFLLFLLFSAASPPFLFVESADVNTINNAFPFNGFSYEIAGNSEACGNIVEDLRYDSNVSNYDLNISTTLKKLSKKGGWLKIHPGIYNLTTSISIPSRVCFAGTHPDKVVLDAKIPVANGFSAINLKGVTRSTLVNFTLKTNATNGIYISYSSYVFVKSVDATGVAGSNRKYRV